MSTHLPSRKTRNEDLPHDAVALRLEAKGLWRRAGTRWQQLVLQATDYRQAEAIVQRQRYCLQQVHRRRQAASDGIAPAGDGMTAMGPLSWPDLWRTA
ncbi:PerC family transcriptional regulator [Serratia liquefaciens]|jgi:hypothetical protein|uniref:PerC family transcriptional regulator n=1 Tax=Serratia liquefaciens TaxID=614 RepID=UPI0022B9E2B2|nr:PerC family transcriptional regulator [Serratia liquefaciens]